jgi:hypothetical protein
MDGCSGYCCCFPASILLLKDKKSRVFLSLESSGVCARNIKFPRSVFGISRGLVFLQIFFSVGARLPTHGRRRRRDERVKERAQMCYKCKSECSTQKEGGGAAKE